MIVADPTPPLGAEPNGGASLIGKLTSHHLWAVLSTRAEVADYSSAMFLDALRGAVAEAGLTAVGELAAAFEPHGTSVAVLLLESHVVLHHWPECRKLTVDIHVCDYSQENLGRARALALAIERAVSSAEGERIWRCETVVG